MGFSIPQITSSNRDWLQGLRSEDVSQGPRPWMDALLDQCVLSLDTKLDGYPLKCLAGSLASFVYLESSPVGLDPTSKALDILGHAIVGECQENWNGLQGLWRVLQSETDPASRLSLLVISGPSHQALENLFANVRQHPSVLFAPACRSEAKEALTRLHGRGWGFPEWVICDWNKDWSGHQAREIYPGHPCLAMKPGPEDEVYGDHWKQKGHRWFQIPHDLGPGVRREWRSTRGESPQWLADLDAACIERGPGPWMPHLLKNSFLYPAYSVDGWDISPLRHFHREMDSYVYTAPIDAEVLKGLRSAVPGGEGLPDHRVVGISHFNINDLTPLPEVEAPRGGTWVVFESRDGRRLSVLFLPPTTSGEPLVEILPRYLKANSGPKGILLAQHSGFSWWDDRVTEAFEKHDLTRHLEWFLVGQNRDRCGWACPWRGVGFQNIGWGSDYEFRFADEPRTIHHLVPNQADI